MEKLLIQILRNQLTDLRAVYSYSITQKDEKRHREYASRIKETEELLNSLRL